MRSLFVSLLIVLMLAATASAFTIAGSPDPINVGDVDLFLGETAKAGNPDAEAIWVNSVLSAQDPASSAIYSVKDEDIDIFAVIENADLYAFYMEGSTAEYFLIKNATRMALFENNDFLDWGVIDVSYLSSEMNIPNDWTISHVTRFNEAAPVPEPSTFLLLGGGLVGLAFYGRKRSKK